MLQDIYFALWFMLPAAIANASPIFTAHAPYLNKLTAPIDNGRTFRGKALLGPHKTWRGLIGGILVSTLIFWLERRFQNNFSFVQHVAGGTAYLTIPVLLLGPLFGLGALGGDALESFVKRQRGIESGKRWIPFDQLDYIIGTVLITLPLMLFALMVYVWIFILWTLTHLVASAIGWLMGLKDEPI